MGAALLKTPELALDGSEAKVYAEAIQNVAQYYPVFLSPEQLAWIQLTLTASGLYGSRIVAIVARREQERRMKRPAVSPAPAAAPPAAGTGTATAAAPNGKIKEDRPLNPQELFGAADSGVNDSLNNLQ